MAAIVMLVLGLGAAFGDQIFSQVITLITGASGQTQSAVTGSPTIGPLTVQSCVGCAPILIPSAITVNNFTGNSAMYIETDNPGFNHTLTITIQIHTSSCPAVPTGSQITASTAPVLMGSTGVKDYCLYFDTIPSSTQIQLQVNWSHH